MKTLKKIAEVISKCEMNFCASVLFVMVSLNFLEISRRILFSQSFVWVQELSLVMICWIVYIGVAYIYSTSHLLYVDFLYERTRGRVRLVWNVFTHILILCVLVLMAIYGWQFAIVQNAASTYALHLPTSLYSIPLVIASFSMILTFVLRVHEFIEEYRRTA